MGVSPTEAVFVYSLLYIYSLGVWWLVSLGITLIHTVDEIDPFNESEPIWNYLEDVTSIPSWVLLPGYFAFQLIVAALSFVAAAYLLPLPLIAIRLVDFGFTHGVLAWLHSPNPGQTTKWLLLADAAVWLLIWQVNFV